MQGVVAEIKDEQTRASLQILPYEFHFKEPSSEAIKFVSQFAKKTGDFQNLSVVDLHLIALTYQICRENMSPEEFGQLKSEPPKDNQPLINANNIKLDKPVNVVGFYLPQRAGKKPSEEEQLAESLDAGLKLAEGVKDLNNNSGAPEEQEADDGEGWITPANLEEAKKLSQLSGEEKEIQEDSQIKVGCMTSDFSMQVLWARAGVGGKRFLKGYFACRTC